MRKKILTLAVIAATTLMFAACGQSADGNETYGDDYGINTEMNGRFETIVDEEDETPTVTVAPTDAPEVTEEPEIVEPTVEPTVEPVPTEEPEVIEPTVEPTAAPTEAPEIIEPEPTDVPEVVEPTKAPEPTATPKPTATPVPTATPKPTEAPKPTKAPVVESKDFKTVLRDIYNLLSYDERAEYIAKLDKSAYKVGTIAADKYFTTGNIDKHFTGDKYDFSGERYDGYFTGAGCEYKLITIEDLFTGEVDVWGVEFTVSNGDETKIDVMIIDDAIIRYNNNEYAEEYGTILDWPTLKYYDDIWHPADYLE